MGKFDNVKWKENGKLKLLIIVGTRPEIIRLAAVINKTRKYFDVILAHTGQNYDYNLNGVFFKDLKLDDPEVYLISLWLKLSLTQCLFWAIQTVAFRLSVLKGFIFRFSIWRQATDVRTSACRRKPTEELLILFRM